MRTLILSFAYCFLFGVLCAGFQAFIDSEDCDVMNSPICSECRTKLIQAGFHCFAGGCHARAHAAGLLIQWDWTERPEELRSTLRSEIERAARSNPNCTYFDSCLALSPN